MNTPILTFFEKKLVPFRDLALFFTLVIVLGSFYSCAPDDDSAFNTDEKLEVLLQARSFNQGIEYFKLPESEELNSIPQDPKNQLSAEKIKLGQLLFHETALAINPIKAEGTFTYSCASCHSAGAGFQASKAQGIGEGGIGFSNAGGDRTKNEAYEVSELDIQPVRTPTLLNGAYQECMLWNGQFGATGPNEDTQANWTPGTPKEINNLGYEGLETQAIAGLKVHRLDIDMNHLSQFGYKEMFDEVFPEFPLGNRYTKETAGLAIAAYERSVLANKAPFQQWLRGNQVALSENQKKGALLFFGKADCVKCHTGPALNSMSFHALGLNDLSGDVHGIIDPATKKGRGGFTNNPDDDYTFKTPQLYNLENSKFYGHGASFTSIEEVIRYKNEGVAENSAVSTTQLSPDFKPLNLTDQEIDLIVDFISNGLNDINLQRYTPEIIPSGFCFPVADEQSKIDLGCD